MTSRWISGDWGGADSSDPPLQVLREDKYGEVVLERLQEEVELPVFQELEEVKLKPSIFGLMCKELVVAPCIDLFASYRRHQLPRYYSAYEDDSTVLGLTAFAYVCDSGTPHWKEAPWYGLLMELTVRSYELMGRLYLTESGNLRPIPKWFTLFSYVVGKRQVLTELELAEELAGEQ